MIEFMDMNEDCLEQVLRACDPESIVAFSYTCKQLNRIATGLFKSVTIYNCSIESLEDDERALNAIAHVGRHLIELNLNINNGPEKSRRGFVYNLSRMCPNLQIVNVVQCDSPKTILRRVKSLKYLSKLSILGSSDLDEMNEEKSAKVLTETVINFVNQAKTLNSFHFGLYEFHFDKEFLEKLRKCGNLFEAKGLILMRLAFNGLAAVDDVMKITLDLQKRKRKTGEASDEADSTLAEAQKVVKKAKSTWERVFNSAGE